MIALFGYVRPLKSELLVREFEVYNGVYCSLCRRLGSDYGLFARFALNYDCTFYVLFQLAQPSSGFPGITRGRCGVNPLKRCVYCGTKEEAFGSAAALAVILSWYRILDGIADSRFLKSIPYRLLLLFAIRPHKKACRQYPVLEKVVSDAMRAQSETEHTDSPEPDRCAHPTAEMLAELFQLTGEGPQGRIFHEAGYYLGRWVYLIDAADDMEKDVRSGAFNPFALKFGLDEKSEPQQFQQARDYANQVLNATVSRMQAAVNLLEFNSSGPIVKNLVFQGLPAMQKQILFEKENQNVRSV